jgi:hypothetical protein
MGYLIVPDNSKGKWWCKEPCQHKDCAANRKDWEIDNKCGICGKALKAGDKFYYTEQGKTAKEHFLCSIARDSK